MKAFFRGLFENLCVCVDFSQIICVDCRQMSQHTVESTEMWNPLPPTPINVIVL